MDPALWLLLRLRWGGWRRRVRRSVATIKGAFLVLLGVLLLAVWLLPTFLAAAPATPEHLAAVRRYGPFLLIVYLLLTLVSSAGERFITFSPAEVDLLFTGPFSRRQLLLYKILSTLPATVLTGLLFAVIFRTHSRLYMAAFVGAVLALLFVQLLAMAVMLVGSTVGARAYTRGRKVALYLLLAVGVAFGVRASGVFEGGGFRAPLGPNPAGWEVALWPLRVFIEAFTAERVWPNLVAWALPCVALDALLLVVVFALDANYLETSAAAGERLYARLQRMRSGGGVWALPRAKKARFSLPTLPGWGGAGAIAWRQLTAAVRQPIGVLYVFGMLALMSVSGGLAAAEEREGLLGGVYLGAMLAGASVFLTPLMAFDFRGDLERMELLKSLPIASWRLAVGQLVTPVLLITGMELVLTAIVLGATGRPDPAFLLVMVFALPFNFLLFGLENLLFLWFPVRLIHATPGDLQGMGRLMVFFFVKAVGLGIAVGAVALVVALSHWALATFGGREGWGLPLAAGWVVLTAFAVALVPPVADAFERFDVARDTPPT